MEKQMMNPFFRRKKITLPVYPNAVNPLGEAKTTTTTAVLYSQGDQPVKLQSIGGTHHIGAKMTAQNDEVVLTWDVPDDFCSGDPTYIWMTFAKGASTTTCVFSYDVKYDTTKAVDVAFPTNVEALGEAATAMSTDLDEAITLTSLTRYGLYRGMRGVINGGLLERGDRVQFKIEADAAPTGSGKIFVLGLEIDYGLRIREDKLEYYK